MQAGEGKLLLGLDPGRTDDPPPRDPSDPVLQHRGLADAGLSSKHKRTAVARADVGDEAVDYLALAAPVQQHRANLPRGVGGPDRCLRMPATAAPSSPPQIG